MRQLRPFFAIASGATQEILLKNEADQPISFYRRNICNGPVFIRKLFSPLVNRPNCINEDEYPAYFTRRSRAFLNARTYLLVIIIIKWLVTRTSHKELLVAELIQNSTSRHCSRVWAFGKVEVNRPWDLALWGPRANQHPCPRKRWYSGCRICFRFSCASSSALRTDKWDLKRGKFSTYFLYLLLTSSCVQQSRMWLNAGCWLIFF